MSVHKLFRVSLSIIDLEIQCSQSLILICEYQCYNVHWEFVCCKGLNSYNLYKQAKYSLTSIKRPLSVTRQLAAFKRWPFNRGSPQKFLGRGPVFSLSNISTNKCEWRKSRTMMHGYNTVRNATKSQRNNYMNRRNVSVNQTLACVLYKQTKTLRDFVLKYC